MTEIEFNKKWDTAFRNSKRKIRKCLVDGCNQIAIKSHALQKNGVLRQISEKNHLYQFSFVSAFQKGKKGDYELSRIGINDVYTFPGFCKNHDSSVFNPIERKYFDIESSQSINLFSYRSLCQEIRKKEMAIDICQELIEKGLNIELMILIIGFKKGASKSLESLFFFKKQLEWDLKNLDQKFIHKICEIPKTEICISSPLSVIDSKNSLSLGQSNPFVTSILNLFPYGDKSYLMITLSKDYFCNWTESQFKKFQNTTSPNHLKLISDLLATRCEFWCMSPQLKNSISNNKFKELFSICNKEAYNFNYDIDTEFNLFN